MSTTRSSASQKRQSVTGVSYHDRLIMKIGGIMFYRSTGKNSDVEGFVFPCYGIHTTGWIIKPSACHWGVNGRLYSIDQATKELKDIDSIRLRQALIERFSSLSQIYISYQFGHPLWKSPAGVIIEQQFSFDLSRYGTIKFPNHVLFSDEPKKVNQLMKQID